ncbi:hypothetical protein GQ600_8126 [Phytophthora cactorum]|nr:hypothetical protein GQ600_8126 [Phytophthora cactorum]
MSKRWTNCFHSYCRGPIPSMHSGFVVTSTVAAWLDLKPSNVAILLAPNNDQMSVFATCCTLYCTDASSFPENFGNELLSAYLHHIKLAESGRQSFSEHLAAMIPKTQHTPVDYRDLKRDSLRTLAKLQVVEGEAGLKEDDKGRHRVPSNGVAAAYQTDGRDHLGSASSVAANGNAAHASSFTEQQRRNSSAKAMRYDGPSAVTFLLGQPDIRTPFGDLTLEKIDVIRKAHRNRVDIYLLFHVDAGHGQTKVLPLRHLFRFALPDAIREKVIMMGASEASLDENAPSSFDMGAGIMPFDEEYARWLQHLHPGNNYDDELVRGIPVTDVQPSLDYRIVSIETEVNEPPPPARDQQGRRPHNTKCRGASASLINQLPTYTFSTAQEHNDQEKPRLFDLPLQLRSWRGDQVVPCSTRIIPTVSTRGCP